MASRNLHRSPTIAILTHSPILKDAQADARRHHCWWLSAVSSDRSSGLPVDTGLELQYQKLSVVPILQLHHRQELTEQAPAVEVEVVCLGVGRYAVVYFVRELLSRYPADGDGECSDEKGKDEESNNWSTMDRGDGRLRVKTDCARAKTSVWGEKREYGRVHTVKCLRKSNLDEEALEAQMVEVCIALTYLFSS